MIKTSIRRVTNCSTVFTEVNNSVVTNNLCITVVDSDNNISQCYGVNSEFIIDPCPLPEISTCGCPVDVCDQSIRVNIKYNPANITPPPQSSGQYDANQYNNDQYYV